MSILSGLKRRMIMNISLNCKISLSKKLRALLKNGGTITLTTSDLVDGKGDGKLSIFSEGDLTTFSELPEELKSETSIMLTPIEIADEVPSANTKMHASIFNNLPKKGESDPIVDRIAATHAPEKNEVARAIKKEIVIPEAFETLNEPECKEYITDLQELIATANLTSKNKKGNDIDVESATSDRERVILMELKSKADAIDVPAWIVNDKVGRLTINDLDISLPLNVPTNLGNVSARKILASRDLRGLIKDGYVKFITPDEIEGFMGESEVTQDRGSLEVFDNVDEAMAKAFKTKGKHTESTKPSRSIRRRDEIEDGDEDTREEEVIDLEQEDLDRPTEEESMVLNLTKNAPKVKSFSNTPTSHGNRPTTHSNKPKTTSVPTIKRRE